MKLKEVLDKTTQFFKDKKIDTARFDAELLLAHGLRLSERIQLYLKFDQPLSEEELATCRDLVRRRAQGEPVAYILGTKDFFGYSFQVNSSVLIPRPETEHIVEAAMDWAEDSNLEFKIADLGAGSGCIGLTLLKKFPNAKLITVDISEDALALVKTNAENLGVSERVRIVNTDAANTDQVLSALREFTGASEIDVLVSNPPYIAFEDKDVEENVKKFEPEIALFAADNGLKFLIDWSKKYSPFLSKNAIVLMEMGMSQGPAMKKAFEDLGVFESVDIIKDLAKHDRIIRGVKNG